MKNLRRKNRLTQTQLGQRLRVTQQYISLIECGDIEILTLGKLFKLASVFNISPCKLLYILIRDKKKRGN